MSDTPIPSKFNGNSTSYSFGDGFRKLGTFGKVVDAGLLIFSGGTIPAVIEVLAWNDAKNNARAARAAVENGQLRFISADKSMQIDSPSQEVSTKFRDQIAQSRNAASLTQR